MEEISGKFVSFTRGCTLKKRFFFPRIWGIWHKIPLERSRDEFLSDGDASTLDFSEIAWIFQKSDFWSFSTSVCLFPRAIFSVESHFSALKQEQCCSQLRGPEPIFQIYHNYLKWYPLGSRSLGASFELSTTLVRPLATILDHFELFFFEQKKFDFFLWKIHTSFEKKVFDFFLEKQNRMFFSKLFFEKKCFFRIIFQTKKIKVI